MTYKNQIVKNSLKIYFPQTNNRYTLNISAIEKYPESLFFFYINHMDVLTTHNELVLNRSDSCFEFIKDIVENNEFNINKLNYYELVTLWNDMTFYGITDSELWNSCYLYSCGKMFYEFICRTSGIVIYRKSFFTPIQNFYFCPSIALVYVNILDINSILENILLYLHESGQTNIKNIAFSRCNIRFDNMNYLASLLTYLSHDILTINLEIILTLYYLDNKIDSLCCADLITSFESSFPSNLVSFNLSCNPLKTEGLNVILTLFRHQPLMHLTDLDIHQCDINDDGFLTLFHCIKDHYIPLLEQLDISYNRIGLQGVQEISKCIENGYLSNLKIINLSNGCLPKLRLLDFTGNLITSDGLQLVDIIIQQYPSIHFPELLCKEIE
ncbi:hypothetical protein WA158_001536 [Blastocystis sp. Blastoise]